VISKYLICVNSTEKNVFFQIGIFIKISESVVKATHAFALAKMELLKDKAELLKPYLKFLKHD